MKRPLKLALGGCGAGCLGVVVLVVAAAVWLASATSRVPRSYPASSSPIPPPDPANRLGGGLAGFDSPYLGHTGSWDGKGGDMFGGSKARDMDHEREMGLRWTFMAVHWRAMEPDHPVDLAGEMPPAWRELDAFVVAARDRGLNILMQAPVVGGNAGGPPKWAGIREAGKAAPVNLDAAAEFAGKLAARYRPGGILAKSREWGDTFGVRAWEIDNEPDSYRTCWKGQASIYAELVEKTAARIKLADPQAVILAPAVAGGGHGSSWVAEALGDGQERALARFSIGRAADVASFHCYEGLETGLLGEDRTIERDFDELREMFEKWEKRLPGREYARKTEYWHTEGNFDFLGVMSAKRRAAWRWQFLTRAFAAGIRKATVMDASAAERIAVGAYVSALPNPFPMTPRTSEVRLLGGRAAVFQHEDDSAPDAGQVWVAWALAGEGDAVVEVPARRKSVALLAVDGRRSYLDTPQGWARLRLPGDSKMAPGVIVVDRPAPPAK